MDISIFGLGYVGTVSAACLSKHGNRVIGVDTNPLKVEAIQSGISPIVEPGMTELLQSALSGRLLSATVDPHEAVANSSLSLVCVGTPSRHNGSLNLDFVYDVARQIGDALKLKPSYHGIAVRSTVMPGTVMRMASIISDASGKALGRDFGVAANPEFLREGTAVDDFEHPPFTVVGASDARIEQLLRKIYHHLFAPFYSLDIATAEFLKYACNSFHALKVAFANEIGAVCKQLKIDSYAVMDVFVKDTKLNISPYYLRPGLPFGGSCLPKDVRALAYQSHLLDVSVPLLDAVLLSNDAHINRTIDLVIETGKKKVGILGLSFKPDSDDMRESPMVRIVETLIGKGFHISIYDANVNLSRLIGANKRFIEQEIPHIASLMKRSMQEVIDDSEVILVGNKTPEFSRVLQLTQSNQVIFDLVRIKEDLKQVEPRYAAVCW